MWWGVSEDTAWTQVRWLLSLQMSLGFDPSCKLIVVQYWVSVHFRALESRIFNIFFTHLNWQNISGILGMIISIIINLFDPKVLMIYSVRSAESNAKFQGYPYLLDLSCEGYSEYGNFHGLTATIWPNCQPPNIPPFLGYWNKCQRVHVYYKVLMESALISQCLQSSCIHEAWSQLLHLAAWPHIILYLHSTKNNDFHSACKSRMDQEKWQPLVDLYARYSPLHLLCQQGCIMYGNFENNNQCWLQIKWVTPRTFMYMHSNLIDSFIRYMAVITRLLQLPWYNVHCTSSISLRP